MNTERDKFLTEAMGLCWHDIINHVSGFMEVRVAYFCKKCKIQGRDVYNLDFSTWSSFGILWEWSIKQNWWEKLSCALHLRFYDESKEISYVSIENNGYDSRISEQYINPDLFADKIYEFLKFVEESKK